MGFLQLLEYLKPGAKAAARSWNPLEGMTLDDITGGLETAGMAVNPLLALYNREESPTLQIPEATLSTIQEPMEETFKEAFQEENPLRQAALFAAGSVPVLGPALREPEQFALEAYDEAIKGGMDTEEAFSKAAIPALVGGAAGSVIDPLAVLNAPKVGKSSKLGKVGEAADNVHEMSVIENPDAYASRKTSKFVSDRAKDVLKDWDKTVGGRKLEVYANVLADDLIARLEENPLDVPYEMTSGDAIAVEAGFRPKTFGYTRQIADPKTGARVGAKVGINYHQILEGLVEDLDSLSVAKPADVGNRVVYEGAGSPDYLRSVITNPELFKKDFIHRVIGTSLHEMTHALYQNANHSDAAAHAIFNQIQKLVMDSVTTDMYTTWVDDFDRLGLGDTLDGLRSQYARIFLEDRPAPITSLFEEAGTGRSGIPESVGQGGRIAPSSELERALRQSVNYFKEIDREGVQASADLSGKGNTLLDRVESILAEPVKSGMQMRDWLNRFDEARKELEASGVDPEFLADLDERLSTKVSDISGGQQKFSFTPDEANWEAEKSLRGLKNVEDVQASEDVGGKKTNLERLLEESIKKTAEEKGLKIEDSRLEMDEPTATHNVLDQGKFITEEEWNRRHGEKEVPTFEGERPGFLTEEEWAAKHKEPFETEYSEAELNKLKEKILEAQKAEEAKTRLTSEREELSLRKKQEAAQQKEEFQRTKDAEAILRQQYREEIKAMRQKLKEGNRSAAEEAKLIQKIEKLQARERQLIKKAKERADIKSEKERIALTDRIEREQAKEAAKKKKDEERPELNPLVRAGLEIKTLKASYDISAPFRQGAILFARRPLVGLKALGDMFTSLVSEGKYQDFEKQLLSRENATKGVYKEAGLDLTEFDSDAPLAAREEQFLGVLASKLPGVKASGRAFNAFLNRLRADSFDATLKSFEKAGYPVTPELKRALGGFINNATGRGELKGWFAKNAVELNSTFFSPRWIKSRLTMLNPRYYSKLPAPVRKEALRSMVHLTGAIMGMMALAKATGQGDIETDPTSSDFGKVQLGNMRLDFGAGFLPYITFLAREMDAIPKWLAGEKLPYGKDPASLAWKFTRQKTSPLASGVLDITSGTTSIGEPTRDSSGIKWDVVGKDVFAPMFLEDLVEVMQEEKVTPLQKGISLPAMAMGAGGYAKTEYPSKRKKSPSTSKSKKEEVPSLY